MEIQYPKSKILDSGAKNLIELITYKYSLLGFCQDLVSQNGQKLPFWSKSQT